MSSCVERLEVISGPTGRRRWPDEVKARIVAETLERGVRVKDVAERHGVQPQQVTAWRRLVRSGKLAIPAEEGDRVRGAGDRAPPAVEAPHKVPSAAPIEIGAGVLWSACRATRQRAGRRDRPRVRP